MGQYYVCMMTNQKRTLYTGVTNDLARRVYEHKNKLVDGFTKRYNLTWLAYYGVTDDIMSAIVREKQIKGWRRSKKDALIASANPQVEGPGKGLVWRVVSGFRPFAALRVTDMEQAVV